MEECAREVANKTKMNKTENKDRMAGRQSVSQSVSESCSSRQEGSTFNKCILNKQWQQIDSAN